MSDLQTSLVVNLDGNLPQRTDRYSRSLERMGQRGQRQMRLLNRSVKAVGSGLDRLGNRYTSLITGAGLTLAARQVATLETRFTRLGIQANKSDAYMQKLKKTIFEVAQEREIRVDPTQVTSAIESIVEKTGDLAFAEANIRNIGLAIQATGAEGQAIGEIMGEFQKMGLVDPKGVMETLDILNVQGKEGAFTLQHLARLGPRVISAYTSTGRTGTEAMREMGAALQMIRMGTDSSETASTAFEATIRVLRDPAKLKKLRAAGVQVYESIGGKSVMRPINELMEEIIKAAGGDGQKLARVFDAESIKAFNAASSEFLRSGELAKLKQLMNVQADGSTTMKDAARAAGTFDASLQNLLTAWQQFQDNQLTGPIQDAADALNSLEPGTVQQWLEVGKGIAIVAAGAIALRKAGQAYSWAKGIKAGASRGGIGGALAGAAGMGNAQPVYVVNMPGGGMGGLDGGSSRRGGRGVNRSLGYNPAKASWRARTVGNMARWGGSALGWMGLNSSVLGGSVTGAGAGAASLGVGVAGAAGYGVGTAINKAFIEGTETQVDIGRAIAKTLAFFGNDDAQAALDAEKRAQASLKIEVDDKRVNIKAVEADGMDVDALGGSMVAP